MTRDNLIRQIIKRILAIKTSYPIKVAIDGVDAVGKTTFANELAKELRRKKIKVIRASLDCFHNPKKIRYKKGNNSPVGYYYDSFNYKALINQLLKPLGKNGSYRYKTKVFNYLTDKKVETKSLKADKNSILIFDGVFLFRKELIKYWDYKIFIHADFKETLKRAVKRERDQYYLGNKQQIISKYKTRYISGQRIYLQRVKPRKLADIIIDNNSFKIRLSETNTSSKIVR